MALPLHGAVAGRAFCFLPLPLPSGLPCHVNGCFALTSNRRELWHEDADKQYATASRTESVAVPQQSCAAAQRSVGSRVVPQQSSRFIPLSLVGANGARRFLADAGHARKAKWNALLCSRALPTLYAHALEHLASSHGDLVSSHGDLASSRRGPTEHATHDRGALLGALLPTGAESHGALWTSVQRGTLHAVPSKMQSMLWITD